MATDINLNNNCLSFKTRKLSRSLSRLYDAQLANIGLKSTQFTLLCHLMKYSPVTSGELARHMGLDASTLTRNLQPMICAGWAIQNSGSDARSRINSITSAGRDKQQEANIHWRAAQQRTVNLLGLERFHALNLLLGECNKILDEEA